MKLFTVHDPEFKKYGREIKGYDLSEVMEAMEKTPCPDSVLYVPSDPQMESLPFFREITRREFGGLPAQFGYCNGQNKVLNALEYHRSSEINIACTDLVLILGAEQDIDWETYTYDTSKAEAFFVPKGTMLEVYGTSLHYAPCNTEKSGFRCVVLLHRGTNQPLEEKPAAEGEDRLLFARNKWLLAHEEAVSEIEQGAFPGLKGENLHID